MAVHLRSPGAAIRRPAFDVTPIGLAVAMAHIDAAIAERARNQLGLITYEQCDAIGCT